MDTSRSRPRIQRPCPSEMNSLNHKETQNDKQKLRKYLLPGLPTAEPPRREHRKLTNLDIGPHRGKLQLDTCANTDENSPAPSQKQKNLAWLWGGPPTLPQKSILISTRQRDMPKLDTSLLALSPNKVESALVKRKERFSLAFYPNPRGPKSAL